MAFACTWSMAMTRYNNVITRKRPCIMPGGCRDGKRFDSSYARYDEFRFRPYANQVIAGWDIVVSHMQPGDKVFAHLPAKYAYGEKGLPGRIPPNTDLLFFIHLIEVKSR